MQLKFSDLKKKRVVNVLDGKFLGYMTDLVFTFPEGKIQGFLCLPKKQLFCKDELLISLCDINKIGDDTVLVCLKNCDKKIDDYGDNFNE